MSPYDQPRPYIVLVYKYEEIGFNPYKRITGHNISTGFANTKIIHDILTISVFLSQILYPLSFRTVSLINSDLSIYYMTSYPI